jgi:hypothetical protein
MTVEIRIANNDDAVEWDAIINQSPHGTLFHTWNWLKIVERNTKTKLFPLIGMKDNIPIGLFPLFFKKKGPINMVFSPPPHVDLLYLGPVLARYDMLRQRKKEEIYFNFQNSVEKYIINNLKGNYIRISLSPALQDPRPFSWSGYTIEPNYDYTIDLSKGIDMLFKSIDRGHRSALKKAKERGMIVQIGSRTDCEKIIDLMDIRYAQQAKYVSASKKYYLDIFDQFKDNLKLFIVVVGGEVVTGWIILHYRDSFYGWYGNSKPKNLVSPSPNNLLFWEIIRYASENKIKYFTTMGAAGDKRLHEYYAERFNPELEIRYVVTKRSFVTGILERGYSNILKPLRGTLKQIGP